MSSTLEVLNPRTGVADYSIEVANRQQVADVCSEARAAQQAWHELGLDGRAEALRSLVAAISNDTHLFEALVADTGRMSIAKVEVTSVPGMLERQIGDAEQVFEPIPEKPTVFPHIFARTQLVPFSVVGVISPWNFPLLLSLIDSMPALLAGSAVVLKPSEVTPRFAHALMNLVAKIPELAPVFRTVTGPGETGADLIDHVDAVAFTGSVRTGRIVAEAAARNFIPAFLEMGGKDPAVVLPGVDVVSTAKAIVRASVAATGQACQSLERVYVHRSQHDDLVAALCSEAEKVELNADSIRRGHIGPFIFSKQADIVASHISDAVSKGATVAFGGEVVEQGGRWLPPTVLTGVNHDMSVMTEETFGPVIPVMAYDTVEEAVVLANDSRYGLSGSVFGPDVDEACAVAQRLDGGAISINDGSLTAMVHEAENDCFKLSGMGRSRMGPSGVARYCRRKALLINRGEAAEITAFGEPDSLGDQMDVADARSLEKTG